MMRRHYTSAMRLYLDLYNHLATLSVLPPAPLVAVRLTDGFMEVGTLHNLSRTEGLTFSDGSCVPTETIAEVWVIG